MTTGSFLDLTPPPTSCRFIRDRLRLTSQYTPRQIKSRFHEDANNLARHSTFCWYDARIVYSKVTPVNSSVFRCNTDRGGYSCVSTSQEEQQNHSPCSGTYGALYLLFYLFPHFFLPLIFFLPIVRVLTITPTSFWRWVSILY